MADEDGGLGVTAATLTAPVKPYGVKILHDPPSLDTGIDVIAIHGLNGHREDTWTYTDKNGTKISWLSTFLPQRMENARILTYGYNAATHGKEELAHQTLLEHARNFAFKLMHFRIQTSTIKRPIVVLAHGVGGIVVKLALLEAFRAHAGHLADLEDLKLSTYGIIFLGTPHHGYRLTSNAEHIVDRMREVLSSNNEHLVKNLHRDSEYLQDLLTTFAAISTFFVIKFIYESQAAVGMDSLVVGRSSAVVQGIANVEVLGMNCDHAGLARFSSADDDDFNTLASLLMIMEQRASENVQSRWETQRFDGNGDLKAATQRMDEIEGILVRYEVILTQIRDRKQEGVPSSDLPLFKEGLPPTPTHTFGREVEIASVRELLLCNHTPRVAILGPGGIGKTTIATTIMNDRNVLAKFSSPLFVLCENLITVPDILNAIADVLAFTTEKRGQNLQVNVMQHLRKAPGTLLCLDNFEDSWDPPKTRGDVEAFLATLDSLHNIAILITMRGIERPRRVTWTTPFLPPIQPLSTESAVALFKSVSQLEDECIPNFVQKVENIPLAVELLARQAGLDGLDDVLERWEQYGLEVVNRRDDSDTRLTSVTKSIEVSLRSPRLTSIPHALDVLRMLAELPNGLSKSMVGKVQHSLLRAMSRRAKLKMRLKRWYTVATLASRSTTAKATQPHPDHAFQVLDQALSTVRYLSLCYFDSHQRYRIHAPVRQHIISTTVLTRKGRSGLMSFFFTLVRNTTSQDYDIMALELSNIRHFVTASEGTWDETHIGACLRYLWWENYLLGICNIDLARTTLSHANTPILEARCRTRISKLLELSSRFEEAERYIRPALSLKMGNPFWEGAVQKGMGEILQALHRYEESEVFLRQAADLFKEVDEPVYEAGALKSLGTLFTVWGRFSDAEKPLKRSLELAKKGGDFLVEGNALSELGRVYIWTGRKSEAEDSLCQAITLYQQSHTVLGEAHAFRSLGDVLRSLGRVEEAERRYLKAQELYRQINDSVGEAMVLDELGVLLTRSEARWDTAERHFQDALVIFQRSERWDYQAFVHQELGDLFLLQCRFSEAITHSVLSIAIRCRHLHKSKWERIVLVSANINDAIEGMCLTNP